MSGGSSLTQAVGSAAVSRVRAGPRLGLIGIVALAVVLRGWRLGDGGFITPYYLAGVRSMLGNWHNFLFNAFDPAGFVSLDKPPVAFWLQTVSAKLLGFSVFSAVLPQALEGIAAILVLFCLVRRRFGEAAGLLAALFLALTPISVAVDRSNNTESCLVLVLLFAAWALIRAIETGRIGLVLLSAALVGIGFNVKMLVAFGVVPVFVMVYLLSAPFGLGRRLRHLGAAAVVLIAVSFSWTLAYELTPPDSRPFVDSTRDNSMIELVVGHNFIQRFVPRAGRWRQTAPLGAAAATPTADQIAAPVPRRDFAPAGPLRLAAPRLAAQMGWFLPLVLIGGIAAWFGVRQSRPVAHGRLDLALWAGWALSYGIVFSAADGLFHAYYLVMMAPPLCALAAIGAVQLWSLYRAGGAPALLLPAALAASGLWQTYIIDEYLTGHLAIGHGWLEPLLIGIPAAATAGLVVMRRLRLRPAGALYGVAGSALLAMPAAWSVGTALVDGVAGFPAARPPFLTDTAATQRGRFAMIAGGLAVDPKLLAFLRDNHLREDYLLAAVNARLAAPIIIATGEPVMALGGFSGGDPILTADGFAQLVVERRVRFALIGDGSPGLRRVFGEGRQAPLVDWIRQNGRPVSPELWRSAPGDTPPAAERIGAELYDLRRTANDGG